MPIEWKQEEPNWYIFKSGDLMLDVELMEADDGEPWLWTVNLNRAEFAGGIEFQSGWASDADAAKLAAEAFAREWIAAQAAALSPGEWTSVVPTGPGYYWQRTPASDEDELNPDTWTDVRLQWWNRPSLIGVLGCVIQFWSVPVEPPPLPEATDES